jgi:cell division protein ZapA
MKQAVEVTILGRQYTVRSSTTPEEVGRVADFVNQQLAQTAMAAPTADTLNITVMTLLNIAGSYLQPQAGEPSLSTQDQQQLESLLERIDSVLGG